MKLGVRVQSKFSGNKILSMRLPNGVVFIDFFNFCPGSLRQIGESFGLQERKTYFPFKLLKQKNYNLELDQLPEKHYYDTELYSKEEMIHFEKFYEEEKKKPFSVTKTCNKYVERDVFVLAECSVMYIKVTMQIEHSLLEANKCFGKIKGSPTPISINNKLVHIDNTHVFSEQFVTLSNYTNHIFKLTSGSQLPIYDNQVSC